MGTIGVSGTIRGEGADGLVGSETWECMRNQGRKGVDPFSILIESQTLVPIYLPGWRGWEQTTFGTCLHL